MIRLFPLYIQAQYIFLYDAVLEGTTSGGTEIPVEGLASRMKELELLNQEGENGYLVEFNVRMLTVVLLYSLIHSHTVCSGEHLCQDCYWSLHKTQFCLCFVSLLWHICPCAVYILELCVCNLRFTVGCSACSAEAASVPSEHQRVHGRQRQCQPVQEPTGQCPPM